MASTINATTSGGGGVITTGDASGTLSLQSSGTTALSINAIAAVFNQSIVETYSTSSISANTLTIDLSAGTVFNVNVTSSFTNFVNSNYAASRAQAFTLFLTGNGTGYTQTWSNTATVKWAGGTAPTLTTTNNKVDIISFVTPNGGASWYGFIGGQNF